MPSTDSTPRIAASWFGTGISTLRSLGLRKNWSICFSASDSEARNSCTTLPIVCRSETRRYRSSIQPSSGEGVPPSRTAEMRSARRRTRTPCSGLSNSPSSSEASRYSKPVATSIASGAAGAAPPCWVSATACVSSAAIASPDGNSRFSESPTSANCSARPLMRCISPPATADHDSFAADTRLRACATSAGSKRPSALAE